MAFKMKNPSMAKMVKAAGDNRAAMKMKMEEKAAAAKMKKEAAMKMKKESMAKLTEKASAMKKDERSLLQRAKDEAKQIGKGLKGAVLQSDYLLSRRGMLDRQQGLKQTGVIKAFKEDYKKEEDKQAAQRKASAKKKSAAKMKKASPAKQKMNMVKGPDGKMVPDFAVDGKGANDLKSAPTKKRTVTKGEDGLKTVTRTNRKGVVRKTKTKGTVTDAFGRKSKIKDKQTQSRGGSKVRIKTKTRTKDDVTGFRVKEKTKGVLSNRKGTDDYKTKKAKTSRRVSTGSTVGKKRTSKSNQNVQATQLLRSQDGFRSYKRPTTGKRAT